MLAQREKSYVEILIEETEEKVRKETEEKVRKETEEKVRKETEEKVTFLYKTLMENGKMQEMQKAMNDEEYRKKLLNEM